MTTFTEHEEKELYNSTRNMRKLILLENWDELGLSNKQRKNFVKYYYEILDEVGIVEALTRFKKL